jgi:hypothetical protein
MVVLLLLLGALLGSTPPVAAGTGCPGAFQLYAVDSRSGHLSEVAHCLAQGGFVSTEVDAGDWRPYRDVLAIRDGTATVIYALASDGELWWRRQEAAGARLGVPVRIGAAIDWSRFRSLFVSQSGYLHGIEAASGVTGGVVRTFRHPGWASGGGSVSEDQPLLTSFAGPSITSVRWGSFAETNTGSHHLRIWRKRSDSLDAVSFRSGSFPAGVAGVVGAEHEGALYGVNGVGHIVRLEQSTKWMICDRVLDTLWRVTAESGESFARVVVPLGPFFGDAPPSVGVDPGGGLRDCPQDSVPWEWQ